MKDLILAKRYINAFCASFPKEKLKKELTALEKVLGDLAKDRVFGYLKSHMTNKKQQRELLEIFLNKYTIHKQTQSFLFLVARKNRLGLAIFFREVITERILRERGAIKVKFISAVDLNQAIRDILIKEFSNRIQQVIQPEFIIDESLIGGLKVQVDHILYDASVANSLLELKKHMVSQPAGR
ncbi:FoF1 ATP synthase subunit delta [Candidatus Margulisiibacteriota bacterium]